MHRTTERGHMTKLTDKMRAVLRGANLDDGTIDNVPLSTLYGLVERGLVPKSKTGGLPPGTTSTMAGRFPQFSGIQLTEAGKRTAQLLRGSKGSVVAAPPKST